jgi:hypothetical protein
MPYQVIKKDNKYAVETIGTHKLHGLTSKKKAEAQMRLLEALIRKGGK